MITINKNYSGLNKEIKINYLDNNWDLEDKVYNFNYLLSLENIDTISKLEKKYNKLLNTLNISKIDYQLLLGNKKIKENLFEIKSTVDILKSRFNPQYEKVFNIRQELVNNLSYCYFNDTNYEIPVYDNYSSLTGRTKIKSGLNFLVMKKSDRNNLTSKYVGGRIYEIDIVSLEPRIMCKITRDEEYKDIYDHVSKNVIDNSYERKNVKLGLISTLYGAKEDTVKKLSGLSKDAVSKIREWFKVDQLNKMLSDQYEANQKITNFYGRNVYSKSSLINHFVQSSAVDSAMIGFYNYINSSPSGIDLIAIIHDAIIVDVHPDNFNFIDNTYYVKDNVMNIKLPIKKEVLS